MRCLVAPASVLALALVIVACGSGGSSAVCETLHTSGCFSNDDCTAASDRCENRGTPAAPVACCVPGARGTGMSGAPCTTENDCATAVCVDESSGGGGSGGFGAATLFCSPACKTDADCPMVLPSCFTLDTGIGTGAFCGPASN